MRLQQDNIITNLRRGTPVEVVFPTLHATARLVVNQGTLVVVQEEDK